MQACHQAGQSRFLIYSDDHGFLFPKGRTPFKASFHKPNALACVEKTGALANSLLIRLSDRSASSVQTKLHVLLAETALQGPLQLWQAIQALPTHELCLRSDSCIDLGVLSMWKRSRASTPGLQLRGPTKATGRDQGLSGHVGAKGSWNSPRSDCNRKAQGTCFFLRAGEGHHGDVVN